MSIQIYSSLPVNYGEDEVYESVKRLLTDLYGEYKLSKDDFLLTFVNSSVFSVFAVDEDTSEIIGIALINKRRRWMGDVWEIDDVVVEKKYRGQNIGRRMNESLLSFAWRKGAPFVDVATRHTDAVPFYKSLGFCEKVDSGFYASMRIIKK